tara:strand:- start:552 stop:1142 length:591 start_codon:yes stop_codon:yes gene_type:complete
MEQLKMRYETYLLKHKAKQNRGAKYSRDTEKLKTYKSEWAFQSRAEIPDFKDLKEAQKFANKLYKSKTWIKLWKKSVEEDVGKIFSGQPQVVGMSRRSKTMSGYTNGTTVTLCPTTGMNKYVLLHELAHCLGHMHHGRSFRQCVLSLVGAFMGAKEKKILKEEFKKKKLACGEPRKPMSYENWVASVRRMEKVRGE